jgi:hypothetical protein
LSQRPIVNVAEADDTTIGPSLSKERETEFSRIATAGCRWLWQGKAYAWRAVRLNRYSPLVCVSVSVTFAANWHVPETHSVAP